MTAGGRVPGTVLCSCINGRACRLWSVPQSVPNYPIFTQIADVTIDDRLSTLSVRIGHTGSLVYRVRQRARCFVKLTKFPYG
jgi:hypothetical protein